MAETMESWFANRPGFWGTTDQICRCARCGSRGTRDMRVGMVPAYHVICDPCYEELPDD